MLDCTYFRIADWRLLEWERVYAPLNVAGELMKMKLWLDANPRRRKKNYQRFVINWLNREAAKVQRQQIEARAYARIGANHNVPAGHAEECQRSIEEISKKYPDLA